MSEVGCGVGWHPPQGSHPQPASAVDPFQIAETSDQNESNIPGEPRRDAVTTARTKARRIGGVSRRGADGEPPWPGPAAPVIAYGAAKTARKGKNSASR